MTKINQLNASFENGRSLVPRPRPLVGGRGLSTCTRLTRHIYISYAIWHETNEAWHETNEAWHETNEAWHETNVRGRGTEAYVGGAQVTIDGINLGEWLAHRVWSLTPSAARKI